MHSTGSILGPNPAFAQAGGWDQTGQAVRLPMDVVALCGPRTALTNSTAVTIPITTTQQILCYQFVSNQIFAPTRFTSSRFQMIIRGLENANTNNAFLNWSLYVIDPASAIIIQALGQVITNAGTEFVATAATRISGPSTLTQSAPMPFRVVLEVGVTAQAPTAAGSFTLRAGCNAASDFAFTSALTTDLNPWWELNENLNAQKFNNYRFVKVGAGMGCSERIR